MDSSEPEPRKSGRTFDSAYGFSFSVAIGLLLFIAGLIIVLTIGQGATIGLIFGIPLLITGLVLPLFMMRDLFRKSDVIGPCPYCNARLQTTDATLRLRCPSCNNVVEVRERTFYRVEQTR
jgi:DNA-directed RNA polymerase subunit RPC12/RpoP